jgi:hypothetical protein
MTGHCHTSLTLRIQWTWLWDHALLACGQVCSSDTALTCTHSLLACGQVSAAAILHTRIWGLLCLCLGSATAAALHHRHRHRHHPWAQAPQDMWPHFMSHGPSCHGCHVVLLRHSSKCQDRTLRKPWPLPFKPIPVHCLPVTPTPDQC